MYKLSIVLTLFYRFEKDDYAVWKGGGQVSEMNGRSRIPHLWAWGLRLLAIYICIASRNDDSWELDGPAAALLIASTSAEVSQQASIFAKVIIMSVKLRIRCIARFETLEKYVRRAPFHEIGNNGNTLYKLQRVTIYIQIRKLWKVTWNEKSMLKKKLRILRSCYLTYCKRLKIQSATFQCLQSAFDSYIFCHVLKHAVACGGSNYRSSRLNAAFSNSNVLLALLRIRVANGKTVAERDPLLLLRFKIPNVDKICRCAMTENVMIWQYLPFVCMIRSHVNVFSWLFQYIVIYIENSHLILSLTMEC